MSSIKLSANDRLLEVVLGESKVIHGILSAQGDRSPSTPLPPLLFKSQ